MSRFPDESRLMATAALLLGATFLACAALALDAAVQHMAAFGAICGQPAAPHCGWCLAAAGFTTLGAAALAAGWRGILAGRQRPVRRRS